MPLSENLFNCFSFQIKKPENVYRNSLRGKGAMAWQVVLDEIIRAVSGRKKGAEVVVAEIK